MNQKIFTKESLIEELKKIRDMGAIPNNRFGNDGSVGNVLEDLLGIEENNLPIPNAAEWELKAQRKNTASLVTLAHLEPSPRTLRAVPRLLLPQYGWPHKEAGAKYSPLERSFRQTVHAAQASDRGFGIVIDREQEKIIFRFDPAIVHERHRQWLADGKLGSFAPEQEPYWGFKDLEHKMGMKLGNCFFVEAEAETIGGVPHFKYTDFMMLKGFKFENFLQLLARGDAFVDFDARTGHNHGTKFRIRKAAFPLLYDTHVRF